LQGDSSFYSHIDIAEVRTEDGRLYLFVAMARPWVAKPLLIDIGNQAELS
jgi:hypothetical protein